MKALWSLAAQSLWSRRLTSGLTMLSIALSVTLLLGIESVRTGARESFSNTISGVDLIGGARGGSLQLLLYTVFRLGSATNNISYETYQHWAEHPAVAWAIPYSLGDSHRGFRVVGTTENFYKHFRYRRDRGIEFEAGRAPSGMFETALGSEVARALGYTVGQKIAITHGLAGDLLQHDDKPFTVTGILARTATPVDRSLYVTLEGISAVHVDWESGAPPMPGEEIPAEQLEREGVKIEQVTAFLLSAKRRVDALRLQREINTYSGEPLMAVIPGVALAEMWRTIGYGETALAVTAFFVLIAGLLGMIVALYTSLEERRREMAVLRAIGARPSSIVMLLVAESALLTVGGVAAGLALTYAALWVAQGPVEQAVGLTLTIGAPSQLAWIYVCCILAAGIVVALLPAWKAYRNTLADGLSARL